MEILARARFVRTSPRKLRLVANVVRKLSLEEALTLLENSPKRASSSLLKVVKQAIANGTKNLGLAREGLKIKKIEIGEGPSYKRWRAVSRGRAHNLQKKTSHITVVLEGEKITKTKKVKSQKPEKPGKKGARKKDGAKS